MTAVLVVSGRFEPVPRFSVETARDVAQRSIGRVRAVDPGKARELEGRLTEAELAVARGRSPLASEIGRIRATGRWQELLLGCYRATSAIRLEQVELGRSWPPAVAAARVALARARGEIRTPGMSARERSALQAAELALSLAGRRAGEGDLNGALAQAALAIRQADVVHGRWLDLHRRFLDAGNLARWRSWADSTIEETRRKGTTAILVVKAERRLELWRAGRRLETLPVELGSNGLMAKVRSGDRATPEGLYRVSVKKGRGQTHYHRALLLDYPNAADRELFRRRQQAGEVPADATPGSLIEIHGGGGQGTDWTDGCIALTDQEMERLFEIVPKGAAVTIVGALAPVGGGGELRAGG